MQENQEQAEADAPRLETDEELVVTSDIGMDSSEEAAADWTHEEDDWPECGQPDIILPPLLPINRPAPTGIRKTLLRQDATMDLRSHLAPRRKRDNKMSKYWCLTENDPTGIVEWMSWLEAGNLPPGVDYMIGQIESGEQGKTHLQGYVELSNRKRLAWLKSHLSATAHFERRRGTATEAIEYCKKEETRITGPWEVGTPTLNTPGKRNDLLLAKMELDKGITLPDLARNDAFFASCAHFYKFFDWYLKNAGLKNPPRRKENLVEVLLLIGKAGTGKTRYAADKYPDAYWKPSQSKWWDGYQGEKTVVFDDLNHGWFTWDTFMRIIDRYPLKVEYKGGYIDFCATTMIITSNTHPRYWYKNMGSRWSALERRITKVLHFFNVDCAPEETTLEMLPEYGAPDEISQHYS